MRWRFLRLDWSYGLGELVIVVTGVLIALAVDQWNQSRLERIEEVQIVERLLADLEIDLANIASAERLLDQKRESLIRIYRALSAGRSDELDPAQFLSDFANAARYGWMQHRANRTTYEELLGSGKFALIRDLALRSHISEYYFFRENEWERTDERETDFPGLVYRLVPLSSDDDFSVDPELSEHELASVTARIFGAGLQDSVLAEVNFEIFARRIFRDIRIEVERLVEDLSIYRESVIRD